MNVWPLRFRELAAGRILFANDAGGYFVADDAFLQRYVAGDLTPSDTSFLLTDGHAFVTESDLEHTSFAWRWTARQAMQRPMWYVMLVPTLRCNLACTYCQVSRAAENARGYDWTDETLGAVRHFLDSLNTDNIKIEFQGGEPLLRRDLLDEVRSFCRGRFAKSEFVVCTNLQRLDADDLSFLDAEDTFVSTSLDGQIVDHDKRRTQDTGAAKTFFSNLETAIGTLGQARISALPTIDINDPPDLEALIDTYERFGFRSIYLRPVNYQGFARRVPPRSDDLTRWNALHARFVRLLIDRNFRTGRVLEEYYFSHCLRRVLQAGHDGHVDLRNPSLPASDYVVVDFDGRLYPSDEARMLARIGRVDLSIGTAAKGLDRERAGGLVPVSVNNYDADCVHCAYQPWCGSDPIDDLSRYGRVDLPRGETWFCGRHLSLFDEALRLIYSRDERELYSLQHWLGLSSWPKSAAPVHS